jgi:plasmid maintenance system antidote protein VapI
MPYDDRDRRYSIHETDETIEQRQQRWVDDHPGEAYQAKRIQDSQGALAWRMDRMEVTIARILENYEGLGSEVAEKLGKQLKSQFTIQSEEHYDHHCWVREEKKRQAEGSKRVNDIKSDVLKYIIIALLGAILLATDFKELFHIK